MAETLIRTFGGNIGIGTTNPGNYKLWVEGGIKADSMRVGGADNTQVPIGLIWMWYGSVSNIPSGWVLCDGRTVARTDGGGDITTPNLVDRFIRGASGDAPSPAVPLTTGGASNITISSPQLPTHNHSVSIGVGNAPHAQHALNTANCPHVHQGTGNANNHQHQPSSGANMYHSHGYDYRSTQPGVGDDFFWAGDCKASQSDEGRNSAAADAYHGHNCNSTGAAHTHPLQTAYVPHGHNTAYELCPHSHPVTLGNAGSGQAVSIKNPYYTLAYIMKR